MEYIVFVRGVGELSQVSLPNNEILQFVRAFIILMEAGASFVIIELLKAIASKYGGGSMQYLFLVLDDIKKPLLVMTFVIFLAHIAFGLHHLHVSAQTGLEFTPPSIQTNITELSAESDSIAKINTKIVVEDNKKLNYIVIDLAKNGGGDSPHTSEGYKSRIEAKDVEIIVPRLVEIHRLADGSLVVAVDSGFTVDGEPDTETTTMNPDEDSVTIALKYATVKIQRNGESIVISYTGKARGQFSSEDELYIVAWACDWIDNEALLVSDPQVERTYIAAYKPSVLSKEGPTLPTNITSRVFTIGLKPFLCAAEYVGIEFSSQNPVTLTISNNTSTYSSSHGFWACIAINANDWDALCRVSPAKIAIGGEKVDIHFLKYPFYYTIFGAFAVFILMSISILGLWNENEEDG